ncbi:cytochrome c1 [Parvularcula lutaonensis]|uniref:Cytochrome c1 n=1 Tax=Parvularcula lutaonensis TaxID=491923 RepID=A0ABV7MCX3_9PROT|nr:cytochrome c1 [Parvularcula lutaonensis]GGY39025.1 ribosomal protein P2 [Parvularcula lutaonensis]
MLKRLLSAAAIAAAALPMAAGAATGGTKPLKDKEWSWEGPFGRYDKPQLQRGFQVYREVCANCHSLKLVAFRHLGEKGGPFYVEECPEELGLGESTDCSVPSQNPIIKSLAAEYTITDGPDEFGDMFERPGLPADYFPSPYANVQQATAANGGAYPPDQSLIAKARPHGPDYIYSLLTGYPDGELNTIEVPPGNYYNPYYPGDTLGLMKEEYLDEEGHLLEDKIREDEKEGYVSKEGYIYGGAFKMAPPLSDGIVTYEDGSPETVSQYAEDVTAFLQWAAEPKLEERKGMGTYVMAYLFIFAGVTYASYRQVWRNVEK